MVAATFSVFPALCMSMGANVGLWSALISTICGRLILPSIFCSSKIIFCTAAFPRSDVFAEDAGFCFVSLAKHMHETQSNSVVVLIIRYMFFVFIKDNPALGCGISCALYLKVRYTKGK